MPAEHIDGHGYRCSTRTATGIVENYWRKPAGRLPNRHRWYLLVAASIGEQAIFNGRWRHNRRLAATPADLRTCSAARPGGCHAPAEIASLTPLDISPHGARSSAAMTTDATPAGAPAVRGRLDPRWGLISPLDTLSGWLLAKGLLDRVAQRRGNAEGSLPR